MRLLQSDPCVDLLITDLALLGGTSGEQLAAAGRAPRPGMKALCISGYAENARVGNGRLEPGSPVMT